jgi:hypothetical protein
MGAHGWDRQISFPTYDCLLPAGAWLLTKVVEVAVDPQLVEASWTPLCDRRRCTAGKSTQSIPRSLVEAGETTVSVPGQPVALPLPGIDKRRKLGDRDALRYSQLFQSAMPHSPSIRSSAGFEPPVPACARRVRAAAVAGALFVWRQLLLPYPMLAVELFARPVFALSVATSVCSFTAQSLAFVSLPFFFEEVLSRSAVQTGLLMTPWPAAVGFVAPIAGWLADKRYPAGILGGMGLATMSVGLVLLNHCTPAVSSIFASARRSASSLTTLLMPSSGGLTASQRNAVTWA